MKTNPDGTVVTEQFDRSLRGERPAGGDPAAEAEVPSLNIPTVQFLATTKPISDQERQTEKERRDLRYLTEQSRGVPVRSTDEYELAPKIPRHYIAPMSEEEWNNQSERDTIKIISSPTTEQNGSAHRPWYM